MWRSEDLTTLSARAGDLSDHLGCSPHRALRWCAAFAAMTALEDAEAVPPDEPPPPRVSMLVELASSI